MDSALLVQLLLSFLIGGSLIGFLSLIAERVPQRVAGLVVSIPSTMPIAMVFIELLVGPGAVKEGISAMPLSLGLSYFFTVAYIAVAVRVPRPRMLSIVLGIAALTTGWFLTAAPIAFFGIDNSLLSLLGYAACTLFMHYMIAVRSGVETTEVTFGMTKLQVLVRSLFAGTLMVIIVFLSKTLGPVWGAIFSVYPAAMLSTMVMVHYAHGERMLYHVCRSMPIGSTTFILYGFIVAYTYTEWGILWGTIAAYAASIIWLLFLKRIGK